MSEVAGSFKLTDSKNLAGCVRCHIDTFHTEESSCSLKIFIDGLPCPTFARIQAVLKNIVAPGYFYQLILKLLTESYPPGLPRFHFLDTESVFEYIRCFKVEDVIYTQSGS